MSTVHTHDIQKGEVHICFVIWNTPSANTVNGTQKKKKKRIKSKNYILNQRFSKCWSQNRNTSMTWALVRNVNYQVLLRPDKSKSGSGGAASSLLWFTVKSENPGLRQLFKTQHNNENFEKHKTRSFIIMFDSIYWVPATYIAQGNKKE